MNKLAIPAGSARNRATAATFLALTSLALSPSVGLLAQTALQGPIARQYQDGEKIAYTLSAFNQTRARAEEYEARAEGVVGKDAAGVFEETFAWTDLQVDDNQVRLSAASKAFREPLSLAPGAKLGIAGLGKVQPALIAPATDLLTLYADVKIAMNQKSLVHPGDHAYVAFGAPDSWADGTKIVVGQDSIDFSIMLQSIDPATGIATYIVRHVPPEQPQIKLPARWMAAPVAASQNNWVQVEKRADGKFAAGVGQETFDVQIRLAAATGRILSATLENPIEVSERLCDDAALITCSAPERYSIHRQITLRADPAPADPVVQ